MLPVFAFTAPTATIRAELSPYSAAQQRQMQGLLAVARKGSTGRRPDGYCYRHVAAFLDAAPGYGKFGRETFTRLVPTAYWAEAHLFARYLNKDDNAAKLGLKRLNITDPYRAPAGAIVVVRAGAPGTVHPTGGDISIADGRGHFYNGGEMSYVRLGSPRDFPPGNDYVVGVYVPAP